MKPTTVIWIGLKNVGDAEPAKKFNGSMFESMKWLIEEMKGIYMKNGIKIVIGRSEEYVDKGIGLRNKYTKSDELLSSLLDGFDEKDFQDPAPMTEDGFSVESSNDDGWEVQK